MSDLQTRRSRRPRRLADHLTAARLLIYVYIDSVPFTRAVLEGRTSLGGSESAAMLVMRGLAERGHQVCCFSSKLELAEGDPHIYSGVEFYSQQQLLSQRHIAPDVFISLRTPAPFSMRTNAGLNILWNQDMLLDVSQVSGALSQLDLLVYVSEYHRQQWEYQQDDITRKTLGAMPSWVTRNPIDLSAVPMWPEQRARLLADCEGYLADLDAKSQALVEEGATAAAVHALRHPAGCVEGETCQPACPTGEVLTTLHAVDGYPVRSRTRFAHISRPERALRPLLAMWPKIRQRVPDAELHICRYSSMYDAQGWGKIVAAYDLEIERVNRQVGGIVLHGELTKPQLYDLLTSCSLLLYPGVSDFAETSCIAVIEAQACGCVPVCSYRGALPETLGPGAGVLIDGDADTEAYQDSFVEQVYTLSHEVEGPPILDDMRAAGRAHITVDRYHYQEVAADWERQILQLFDQRYQDRPLEIMRQLLHYDHHVAATLVAEDLLDTRDGAAQPAATVAEAREAIELCDSVIEQRAQTAAHYAQYAMDTETEAKLSGRFQAVIEQIRQSGARRLVDIACGNGSFALALFQALPNQIEHIVLVDYSSGVLDKAREALTRANIAPERYRLVNVNLARRPSADELGVTADRDAVFCGEYLEHTRDPHLVVDWLESFLRPGGRVFLTTPHGPLSESIEFRVPLQRGHTHHFQMRDLASMLVDKPGLDIGYLSMGVTPRGIESGFWVVTWTRPTEAEPPAPAKPIDHWRTILTTRPYQRLVGTLLVHNVEDWVLKCVKSCWALVDTLVVLNTGSYDLTNELLGKFPNVVIFDAAAEGLDWPRCGFDAARNLTLDLAQRYDPDWVCWIDADEHIIGGDQLHQHLYAGGGPYLGFALKQRHLLVDAPNFHDTPVRVFRNRPDIRFYGMVHEAPEVGAGKGLFPIIDLPHVSVVHYGYETERDRQPKQTGRNMPLLQMELRTPNPRPMAWMFYMRDLNVKALAMGADRGLTPATEALLRGAIKVYDTRGQLNDPLCSAHEHAWQQYQVALKMLNEGFEVVWSFGAGMPTVQKHVSPQSFRARTTEEALAYMQRRTREWLKQLEPPVFLVRPWVEAREADVVLSARDLGVLHFPQPGAETGGHAADSGPTD